MFKVVIILFSLIIYFLGCSHNIRTVKSKFIDKPIAEVSDEKISNVNTNQYSKGIQFLDNIQYDSALVFFKEQYDKNSNDWQINYYLGIIYTKMSEYSLSEKHLFHSLHYAGSDNNTRAFIYAALGANFENQGKIGKAKQHYHTALNLDPQSVKAIKGLKRLNAFSQSTE